MGDKVKSGDVIDVLDDSSLQQQLEQKQAQIASSEKNSSISIKAATDRLNETIRNRDGGTHPQILASENAVKNALDTWQNAERTYNNYVKSLNEGYNDQLVSQGSNDISLVNSQDSAALNLAQAQDKLNQLGNTILEKRNMSNIREMELKSLKDRDRDLTTRINDIQRRIENAKGATQTNTIDPVLKQQLDMALTEKATKENEKLMELAKIPNNQTRIDEIQIEVDRINKSIGEIERQIQNQSQITIGINPSEDITQLTRQLESLQFESTNLKEKISEVSGLVQKYKSEVEAAQAGINSSLEQIEQNKLQMNIAQRNIESAKIQKNLSSKNREDTIATYKKNAEDLKAAYDMSLKNLEVTKITINDEINSLKNALKSAKVSGDNTINVVDIKYIKEDLDKTVITADKEGTITQLNMVIGQVPTSHLAKIETTDRLIIETKIKEFDVNKVKVGLEVEITSDALGESKVFKGRIDSIEPTPIGQASTSTTSQSTASNEVAYGVKVVMEGNSAEIKPGMNVRVKYILEKKVDVFVAPRNAVYKKNEKSFILILGDGEVSEIKELSVDVDAQNDFETVISSNELKGGIRVINSPDAYTPGMTVQLSETAMLEQ